MSKANKTIVLAVLFATLGGSAMAQQSTAPGKYRYVADPATSEYCRNHKLAIPKGELLLRDNYTFSLAMSTKDGVDISQGLYTVKDDLLTFQVNEGRADGLPHVMRLGKRGLNGRGSAFSLVTAFPHDEPNPSDSPLQASLNGSIPIPSSGPAVDDGASLLRSLEGDWIAFRSGAGDPTIRFTIKRNHWSFSGYGVSSSGNLEAGSSPSTFVLIYKTVDGRAPERAMQRAVEFDPVASAFTIEGCQFRKETK